MTPGGSYAEFALVPAFACFHLGHDVSFEVAATVPLAAMTAALGLYQRMDLPLPWRPASAPMPLIVYGGAGAVGSFVIKLAQASNVHPIIAVSGESQGYVRSLLSPERGDSVVDYRLGPDKVAEQLRAALTAAGTEGVTYAYDAVTGHGSWETLQQVLAPSGQLTLVLPFGDFSNLRTDISVSQSAVASIFGQHVFGDNGCSNGNSDETFAHVFFRLFGKGLQEGWLAAHPYEVLNGLEAVEDGLKRLKAGKNRATKYVIRICDD